MDLMGNLSKKPRLGLRSEKHKRYLLGVLFLLPTFAAMLVFNYAPIVVCVFQSFFRYRLNDLPGTFVGVDNYVSVFTSDLFWTSFKNSVVLYVLNILFGFFVPILQALMLFQIKRGRGVFRYLYLFPAGITALAGLSVWKYIWEPDGGLANYVTEALGLGSFNWLYDEATVKFCLRFPAIMGGGMAVILYLVTMNNLSQEHFEAAKIDGASEWQCLRRITLPGIRYMIEIQFLLSLVGGLLAFEDVYILTQGGPGYSSFTLVLDIYTKAFKEQNFGVAMAMSVVVLVFTLVITSLVYYWQHRIEEN